MIQCFSCCPFSFEQRLGVCKEWKGGEKYNVVTFSSIAFCEGAGFTNDLCIGFFR